MANFDEGELERFKQQLEESLIKPAILEPRQISPESQSKLAILNDDAGEVVGVDDIDRMSSIIEMLLKVQSVRIAEKVLLTIAEAQELAGLSREILRHVIASGSLKSKKIGKPWRIKRTDLDSFIENL